MRSVSLLVAIVLWTVPGCSRIEAERTPFPGPLTRSDVPTPIAIGAPVIGAIRPSDPPCARTRSEFGSEPCQRFVVKPLTSGTYHVEVRSSGPHRLALRFAGARDTGVRRLTSTAKLVGGATYDVSISMHREQGGIGSQVFELLARGE